MKTFKKVFFVLALVLVATLGLVACKDKKTPLEALKENYKETLGDSKYQLTAETELVLVSEIKGAKVIWEIKGDGKNFVKHDKETGKVSITQPTYAEGNKSIQFKATVMSSPVETVTFTVAITSLEQTVLEKIEEAFGNVMIFPSSQDGYLRTSLKLVDKVTIDEKEVPVVWESTNEEVIRTNGVVFPSVGKDAEVTLTATISYEGEKVSKTETFKVEAAKYEFPDFETAVTAKAFSGEDKGSVIIVRKVSLYAVGSDSYIVDANGKLLTVHSNQLDMVPGKLYDVAGQTDSYYGTLQLNSLMVAEVEGEAQKPTIQTNTVEEISKVKKLDNNSEFFTSVHKLTDAKAVVATAQNGDAKYQVFLAPWTLTDPNQIKKGSANAIMIYYGSDIEIIRALNGIEFKSIEIVLKGYRSNNGYWYADFIGTIDDIELNIETEQEFVDVAAQAVTSGVKDVYIESTTLTLPKEMIGVGIKWASSDAKVINPETGELTIQDKYVKVNLTATFTKGDATKTVEIPVGVGMPDATNITTALEAENGLFVHVKGVVNAGTYYETAFVQDSENKAIAITIKNDDERAKFNDLVGKTVSVYGRRGVDKGGNNVIEYLGHEVLEDETIQIHIVDGDVLADLTSDTVNAYAALNINFKELKLTDKDIHKKFKNVTLTFERINGQTITMYWDSREVLNTTAATLLNSVTVGKYYNVTANVYKHYSDLLVFTNTTVLEEATLSDATKVELIKTEIKALDGQVVYSGDPIVQPETDSEFGVKLNFSINPLTAVNMSDPQNLKWAEVSEETAVTVTVTFKVGEIDATQNITLTLTKKSTAVGSTASLTINPTANGTFGEDVNEAARFGLDENLFKLYGQKGTKNINIGYNVDGTIRLYGNNNAGNILSLEIIGNYKITKIEIVLATAKKTAASMNLTLGTNPAKVINDPFNTTITEDNLDITKFAMQNTDAGTGQIWIKEMTITYEEVGAATTTEFTVTFDGNGNTAGTVPTAQTVAENGNATAPTDVDLVKDTKAFAHWSTSKDDSTGAFDFANTPITENITLYAIYA